MCGVEMVFNSLAERVVRLTVGYELLLVLRVDYFDVSLIQLLTVLR